MILIGGDDVVAIAWPDGTQVDLMTHPKHHALEHEMPEWAEACYAASSDATKPFAAWCFDHDHARTRMLEQRGYTRTSTHFVSRTCRLDNAFPQPALPPGFTVRHVEGEADLERRVDVHRAAFAPSRMTVVKHRAVMGAPTYRPDLDLIVVAPDDRFAAFCIVWLDDANGLGVFEPVGCHPDFQRRGLGKAVMTEGLRRLHALGATTAYVGSGSKEQSPAANALYDGLGFTVRDCKRKWTKQLVSG